MHLCSSKFCYSRSLPWDETLGSKLWCGQHFVSAFCFIMLCCVSAFCFVMLCCVSAFCFIMLCCVSAFCFIMLCCVSAFCFIMLCCVSAFRFIMLCCASEFGYSTTMLWEVGKQVWFRKLIHFHSAPMCFKVWVSCHCDVDSIQFHDVIVWVRLLVHQNRVMRLRGWKMMRPVVRKVCEWNFVVKKKLTACVSNEDMVGTNIPCCVSDKYRASLSIFVCVSNVYKAGMNLFCCV